MRGEWRANLLGDRCGDADDAVLVADDGVAGAHRHLAALDHALRLPRLHHRRALLGRR
jgi:hypothetical protein